MYSKTGSLKGRILSLPTIIVSAGPKAIFEAIRISHFGGVWEYETGKYPAKPKIERAVRQLKREGYF